VCCTQHIASCLSAKTARSRRLRCVRALRPGGDIAFVTSNRWLLNAGTANLRHVLGKTVNLSHVERLDARSTFYRPKPRRTGTRPRIHPVAVHLRRGAGQVLTRKAIYWRAARLLRRV
jgi:hypothetical protein